MPLNVRNMNIEQRGGTRREVDMGARDTLLTQRTEYKTKKGSGAYSYTLSEDYQLRYSYCECSDLI